MVVLATCVVALVMIVIFHLINVYSKFSRHDIKQLTPVPFVGNIWKIMTKKMHFLDFLEKIYNTFPDDRFVGYYEFLTPLLQIQNLDLIKKVTVKDFEHFVDHRKILDDDVEPLFARNLFALRGQDWKDMRSPLSPAFTSSKIRLMIPFMTEIGEQMIASLNKKIDASERDWIDIDTKDLLTRYTNDVIASCAFGLKIDSHTNEENEFFKMGRTAIHLDGMIIIKLICYNAIPSIMKLLKVSLFSDEKRNFFRNLVLGTIHERETKNIQRNDMIHLLMEAKKGRLIHEEKSIKDIDAGFATVEESEVGKKHINRVWTDDDLTAQALVFFLAGFDTVSTTMIFLLYEIAVNPDVQEKLVSEIKKDYDEIDGKITYQSIQKLSYLDMVVSESLRLWPPIMVTDRMCVKDYNMGRPHENASHDYIIRKGEIINIPIWAIHHSPKYFPDPLKFDPERFSNENKHNIMPFTYLPFGQGPRNCIGSRFALCEVKVMLYLLLLHIEVTPAENTRIPVVLSKQAADSFNLRMEGGHWLRFKKRI